jgi:hypothetical protein
LAAIASAYRDVGAPSEEALEGFAAVLEEIKDEMVAIQDAYVEESNEAYYREHPDIAALMRKLETAPVKPATLLRLAVPPPAEDAASLAQDVDA